jgi:hypothetical protein
MKNEATPEWKGLKQMTSDGKRGNPKMQEANDKNFWHKSHEGDSLNRKV